MEDMSVYLTVDYVILFDGTGGLPGLIRTYRLWYSNHPVHCRTRMLTEVYQHIFANVGIGGRKDNGNAEIHKIELNRTVSFSTKQN